MVLGQVEPAVAHTPFFQERLSKVSHIPGVSPAVRAAVDQENIEWFAIIRELALLFVNDEFMGRAVADRAAFGRFFPPEQKTAYCTSPRGDSSGCGWICGSAELILHANASFTEGI
jgi:hypothetical protein